MITLKRAEIHAGNDDTSVVDKVVQLDITFHPNDFSLNMKQINDEMSGIYPDKHINYVLFSDDKITDIPDKYILKERS